LEQNITIENSTLINTIINKYFSLNAIFNALAFGAFSLLLIFETFSGALRYYFSEANLTFLIYLPKILVLIFVFLKILHTQIRPLLFFIAVLGVYSAIGLLYKGSILNIAFALFEYVPFFFGMLYSKIILEKKNLLFTLITVLLLCNIVGVFLDYYTEVPWKGSSYDLGDIVVEANRKWAAEGGDNADRVAGFGRQSATTAMMLSVYALYIFVYLKSTLLKILLFFITIYCIYLTNSKITIPAYLIGILFYYVLSGRIKSIFPILLKLLVWGGIVFPFLCLLILPLVKMIPEDAIPSWLFSLNDRIVNTWPHIFSIIMNNWAMIFGVGVGNVGGAVTTIGILHDNPLLALKSGGNLGVTDSTPLYLWAMFGFVGIYFFSKFYAIILRLSKIESKVSYALLLSLICICQIGWTTDITEATLSLLFWGMGLAFHYNDVSSQPN
jgi:hypothetical protein